MEEDFSIHLISNVSPETFPANKAQSFSTLLADDIYINGRWEVGLRNIMYPTEISSATDEDKIHFYTHTSLDRKSIVSFKRNKHSTVNDAHRLINVVFPKLTKEYVAKHFPTYVYDLLKRNSKYQKDFFSFKYTKNKKFILSVPTEDTVVEFNDYANKYFGFVSNGIFSKGQYWGWRARHPGYKQQDTGTLQFWVYDLSYFEKKVFKMAYNGKSYVCHEVGLEMVNDANDSHIIDRGNADYKFFQLDKDTRRVMEKASEYPEAVMYKKAPSNKFSKLGEKEWKALKPEVTVWYNHLKKEKVKIEEVGEAITLDGKVDLKDTRQLLEKLNARKTSNGYSISYNEATHRFKLEVGKKYHVRLSPSLWSILGFDEKLSGQHLFDTTIDAEYFPALDRGIRTLILYSNIVEMSFIGNTQAPLLAICPFDRKPNDDDTHVIQKEILKPLYVPLNRNVLHQIDISIHDEAGASIPFIHGKTVLTLHFRKIRN